MSIDTHADLQKAIDHKGTGPIQPEQVLPDYYVSMIKPVQTRKIGSYIIIVIIRSFQRAFAHFRCIKIHAEMEEKSRVKSGNFIFTCALAMLYIYISQLLLHSLLT